jgi:hypothetical protein
MSDLIQRINELKTQAKNRRDLKRWDRAATVLKQAIALAENEYRSTKTPEWRATIASELADCWGILGGVERRWALDPASDPTQRLEHLRRSIEAYDKGYEYEKVSSSSGTSTYNELNRLLVRLLLNPELLSTDGGTTAAETMNVPAELEKIADRIQLGGIDNVWTAADMALLNVLLRRQDATSAYAVFEAMKPPDFALQSALDVLGPLGRLDLPMAAELREAERRLSALRG